MDRPASATISDPETFGSTASHPCAGAAHGDAGDATRMLPSLFADPDGRGARRWGHIFDTARCEPLDLNGLMLPAA